MQSYLRIVIVMFKDSSMNKEKKCSKICGVPPLIMLIQLSCGIDLFTKTTYVQIPFH